MSYQDNYYLVYQSSAIIFNKDKTTMALYYKYYSTLIIYSLKNNVIILFTSFIKFTI